MTEFADKLRSLSFGRSKYRETAERRPVIDERDGSVGGYHTIHWDGSQDAHVTPKPAVLKARIEED